MRKILLLGLAAVFGMTLTSCNDKDDDKATYLTSTNLVPAYNLFTDAAGKKEPFAAIGNYKYTMTSPAYSVQMSVESMLLPGGTVGGFATDVVSMNVNYVQYDNLTAEALSFRIKDANNNPLVSDIRCLLTQAAYAPEEVEGYKIDRLVPNKTASYTVMQYNYGDWLVRTFWPDMTFKGKTVTSGAGMDGSYENEDISYRVKMQLGLGGTLSDKADLYIFNAKFAANMPFEIKLILLKDLDLKFTNDGYEVSGSQIIPFMLEGGQLEETKRFAFNSIKMVVDGDLTQMKADYEVASMYRGSFTGASIKK